MAILAESVLVAAVVAGVLLAVWLLRPQAASQGTPVALAVGVLPTPVPTRTGSPTPSPLPPTPTATETSTITATPPPAVLEYTIEPGDNLYSLAVRFGSYVDSIVAASGLSGPDALLLPGQKVIIPLAPDDAAPPAAQPEPATPAPPADTAQPTTPPTPETSPTAVMVSSITHTIASGDTLLALAIKYDSTVADIVEANGYRNQNVLLHPGDQVIIPLATPVQATLPPPVETVPAEAAEAASQATGTPEVLSSATPTLTASPWPTVSGPTPTPLFPYPAPQLLGPPDGRVFAGRDMAVLLNWTSAGILSDDDWYVVTIRALQTDQAIEKEFWLKTTSWRVEDEFRPAADAGPLVYSWDVVVRREVEGSTAGKRSGPAVSPSSPARQFTWNP